MPRSGAGPRVGRLGAYGQQQQQVPGNLQNATMESTWSLAQPIPNITEDPHPHEKERWRNENAGR
jgi:hypothetical protein